MLLRSTSYFVVAFFLSKSAWLPHACQYQHISNSTSPRTSHRVSLVDCRVIPSTSHIYKYNYSYNYCTCITPAFPTSSIYLCIHILMDTTGVQFLSSEHRHNRAAAARWWKAAAKQSLCSLSSVSSFGCRCFEVCNSRPVYWLRFGVLFFKALAMTLETIRRCQWE